MHLVQYTNENGIHLGVKRDNTIIDVASAGFTGTIQDFIEASSEQRETVISNLEHATSFPLEQVKIVAPLSSPSKIIAIGLNYLDHCREQGIEPPKRPLVFSKFPSSLVGPDDAISWNPQLTNQVDPEVELGVIIGQRTRNISIERALDVVFGYTVANDVSARDLQFGDGQWIRGKSLDTFCPIGPAIVTADEIPDPQNLHLICQIDDRIQQDGNTRDMIFSVAHIISFLSEFCTLEPGDLILTGTPWGVGCFRNPPVYVQPGEVITCTVEGIGTLSNPTKALPTTN